MRSQSRRPRIHIRPGKILRAHEEADDQLSPGDARARTRHQKEYQREARRTSIVQLCISIVFIGKNSRGNWVAQEQNGLYGGLFVNRAQAVKYALFENGHHPEPSSS